MIIPPPVAVVLLWPALLPWLVAAGLPLVMAWWALRQAKPVGWGAIELVERAARAARIDRRGLPPPLTLVRMLLIAAVALAATRPFWGRGPLGERIVGGDPRRRIELVAAESNLDGVGDVSSLAILRALESLAHERPGTVPSVDRVTFATAGRAADQPELLILCDGAVPTPDEAVRLAKAVRGGAAALLCLGPESVTLPRRRQIAAWLEELAGVSVAGSVSLDAEAILVTAVDAAESSGPPTLLAGPRVNRAADLVFGSESQPAATVLARSATTGRPLLVELPVAAGRLVVSALPLTLPSLAASQEAWSDLAVWPAFLPFIDQLVSRLVEPAKPVASPITQLAARFAGQPLARLLLACGGLLALLELALSWRQAQAAGLAFDATAVGARLGVLTFLPMMALVWGGRPAEWPGRPRNSSAVAVVIDVSPSMGSGDGLAASRLERLMQAAAGTDAGNAVFDRLARDRPVMIHTAAETVEPLGRYPADVSRTDLRQLPSHRPAADASRVADAVAGVLDSNEAEEPAAVVIMSDGAITSGGSWAAAVDVAAWRGVPLVAVPVGNDVAPSTELPAGFRFTAAVVPPVCRPGETLTIPVRGVAATPCSRPLPLRGEGGEAQLIAAPTPTGSGYEYTGSRGFSVRIRAGDLPTSTQADNLPLPAEDRTLTLTVGDNEDHVATLPVVVADDQIHVLVIDHGPRYEFRFLSRLLINDTRYAVTTRLVASRDVEALRAAAGLPQTVEDWSSFDVVVLGDVPIETAEADSGAWHALQEAVSSKGVGLAWLPGRRWAESDAGVVGWLPAVPEPLFPISQAASTPRRVLPSGRATGWLSFADGAADATAAFAPRTYSTLPPVTLSPLARVIAVAEIAAGGDPQPAIVVSQLGQGMIVGHLCETWRWQGDVQTPSRTDHSRYWLHILPRLAERRRLARLVATTLAVRPLDPLVGESLRVDVTPTRPTTDLTGWTLVVESPDQEPRQIRVTGSGPGSVATLRLDGLAAGRHRLTVVPPAPADDLPMTMVAHEIVVNERAMETPDGPAGTGPLRAAIEAGGGVVVPLDQIDTLPAVIDTLIGRRRAGSGHSASWLASESAAHLLLAAFVAVCAVAWRPQLNPAPGNESR